MVIVITPEPLPITLPDQTLVYAGHAGSKRYRHIGEQKQFNLRGCLRSLICYT
ncbi:hypothetical protein [Moorena sp. SIO4G3]|uniref:hypothetical protein n=1 Tax=Moorena sp. SIO4G3 TaxID=2607821 RepID=UPI00142C7DE7|nr:hypothetical protein [Moorena sp. SIO4G3]NEO81530.1 hypothetical protein [Moorena sp. SIO4G3]